ncbi:tetratricopeptide repeat protein [Candidatus Sumerlaeota bacterium]|nr:tetratricopeptide repeat protein [Candidatus Sumerlaeota bacterium]
MIGNSAWSADGTLAEVRDVRLITEMQRSRVVVELSNPPDVRHLFPTNDPSRWILRLRPAEVRAGLTTEKINDGRIKNIEWTLDQTEFLLTLRLNAPPDHIKLFMLRNPPTLVADFFSSPTAEIEAATTQTESQPSLRLPIPKPPVSVTPSMEDVFLPPPDMEEVLTIVPVEKEIKAAYSPLNLRKLDFSRLGEELLRVAAEDWPAFEQRFLPLAQRSDWKEMQELAQTFALEPRPTLPEEVCLAALVEAHAQQAGFRQDQSPANPGEALLAVDIARLALRRHPGSRLAPLILMRLAQIYRDLGFTPEATATLGWLNDFGPNEWDPQLLAYAAEILTGLEKWEEARTILEDLLERYPGAPEAQLAQAWIGRCQYALGDPGAAFSALMQAWEADPGLLESNPELLEAWGKASMEQALLTANARSAAQDVNAASTAPEFSMPRRAFERYALLYPQLVAEKPEIAYGLALSLSRLGEFNQAMRQYRDVIETFPDSPQADEARIDLAEMALRDRISGIERAYSELEAYQQPEQTLLRVFRESPHDETAQAAGHIYALHCYLRENNESDALKIWTELSDRFPDSKLLSQISAYAEEIFVPAIRGAHEAGNYRQVVDLVRRHPAFAGVIQANAELTFRVADSWRAMELYEQAALQASYAPNLHEAAPQDLEWAFRACELRADSLYRIGLYDKAAEERRMLLEYDPEGESAPRQLYWLGKIARLERDPETARSQWSQALEHPQLSAQCELDAAADRAALFLSCEDWSAARADLIQAIRAIGRMDLDLRQPLAHRLLAQLAQARYRDGRYADALMTLEPCLEGESDPEEMALIRYQAAQCHIQLLMNSKDKARNSWHADQAEKLLLALRAPGAASAALAAKAGSDLRMLEQLRSVLGLHSSQAYQQ